MILNSGDLFFDKYKFSINEQDPARLKAQLISCLFKRIGCDVLNIGERDLALGVEFLKNLKNTSNFPLISANIINLNHEHIFERYRIKNIGGIKVGIFGLIGDSSEIMSQIATATNGQVLIQDPIQSAASVLESLEGKSDLIIALTHQGVGQDWILAKKFPAISIIIGGHDKQKIPKPYIVNNTFIVQSGEKGQYLGHMKVSISPDFKVVKNDLVPLGNKIVDDKGIRSMIESYYSKLAKIRTPKEKGNSIQQAPIKNKCSECHEVEFNSWRNTPHASAYKSLKERYRQYEVGCLKCHTTRFEEVGGFSIKSHQMELANVQCESCHGYGIQHISEEKSIPVKIVTKEVCLKCHTSDRSPGFLGNYTHYLSQIKHN